MNFSVLFSKTLEIILNYCVCVLTFEITYLAIFYVVGYNIGDGV